MYMRQYRKLVELLIAYVNFSGKHVIWKKRRKYAIRKSVLQSDEFQTSDLANEIIKSTQFLPKDTQLLFRIKAVFQNVTKLPLCKHCNKNAAIAKCDSLSYPLFLPICNDIHCHMKHMSLSRKTTDESRHNHSVSMRNYKIRLQEAYTKCIDTFSSNSYHCLPYEKVKTYACNAIASQNKNGLLVKNDVWMNNIDLICSLIFHTQFIPIDKDMVGVKAFNMPERLYCLANNISQKPTCKFCDSPVKFLGIKHGYYQSCADCQEEKRRLTIGRPTYADVLASIDNSKYEIIDAPNGKISGKKNYLIVKCKRCKKTTKINLHCGTMFTRVMGKGLCKYCDKYVSHDEQELRNIVKNIIRKDEQVLVNDRKIIAPYELDIVVPKHKVAIEFNGIYWHNDNVVSKRYHQVKTMKCEQNGYRLIHVFEDQWHSNKKLCIAHIKRAFSVARCLDASICSYTIIDKLSDKYMKFFKKYSFDKPSKNCKYIEVQYKSYLVACIAFNIKDNIVKMFNIAQMNSINIFNLLSYAANAMLKTYVHIKRIEVEISHNVCNANDYICHGLDFVKYISSKGRWLLHRKEKDLLSLKENSSQHLKSYDTSKSFEENLRTNGYVQVFDAGKILFAKDFEVNSKHAASDVRRP